MQIGANAAIYLLCYCAVLLVVMFVGYGKSKGKKGD